VGRKELRELRFVVSQLLSGRWFSPLMAAGSTAHVQYYGAICTHNT